MTCNGLSPVEEKAACNRIHAKNRAFERFGLFLSYNDLDTIEAVIRGGTSDECRPLRPDNHHEGRTLYAVRMLGKWYPIVFDASTDSVITFPPESALWPYYSTLIPVKVQVAVEPPKFTPEQIQEILTSKGTSGFTELLGDDVPKLSVLSESPTVDEIAMVLAEVNLRKSHIMKRRLDLTRAHWKWPILVAEYDRLLSLGKELKKQRHALRVAAVEQAKGGAKLIVENEESALLVTALTVIKSLAARLNWAVTDKEQAAIQAVQDHFAQMGIFVRTVDAVEEMGDGGTEVAVGRQ